MDSSSISEKIEEKGPSFKWGRKKEKENNSRRPRSNFAPCLAAISLPGKHSSPRQRKHSPPPPPLPTPLPLELANNEDKSIDVSSTPSSFRHHLHRNYSSSSSLIKSKDGGESSRHSDFKKIRRSSTNKITAVAADVFKDCSAKLPSFRQHLDSSFKLKGESSRHFSRRPGESHDNKRRNYDLNPRDYNWVEGYSLKNGGKSTTEKEKKEPKNGETNNLVGIKRSKISTRIPCKKTKPSTEEENPSNKKNPNGEKEKHIEKKPEEKKPMVEKKPVEKNPIEEKKKLMEDKKRVEKKMTEKGKEVEKSPLEEGEVVTKIINEKERNSIGVEDSKIDEEAAKIWSLRLRMPKSKGKEIVLTLKNQKEENKGEKKKKPPKAKLNINIPLTKREIEEDFFALTGGKPPRRPTKRANNVQKDLDVVFPGLGLLGISVDSYKVNGMVR